ncbi:MAG: toprim domain-containing protein [Hyphomicrobiaceae bacterium]
MRETAADLARRLAQNAEAVCREYLSNGRREGSTWRVGDVENTPGRSLMVRLVDTSHGAAGKWTDFATGEHGDLLDLIARSRRFEGFRDVAEEARRFLSLPDTVRSRIRSPAAAGSSEAARRLFASAKPIHGTIAEIYLRGRGITDVRGVNALRFHATCFYRAREDAPRETWPALLAAVTDLRGTIRGVLRTWLARDGSDKAPLSTPRRAMGHLLGNGVRFGVVEYASATTSVIAAGEGLETVLSLRCVLPGMPMVAALSATHLAALVPPPGLERLYVARDNDRAGRRAAEMLAARVQADGVEALILTPSADDFNTDLLALGPDALADSVRMQLAPEDVERFLCAGRRSG